MNPIPWRVILFCLGVASFAFLFASMQGCKHPDMPAIDLEFWAGDADRASIRRKQEDKEIKASDPEFNEFACLTYGDVRLIYATLLECKDWGSLRVMNKYEYRLFKATNHDVIKKASGQTK